VPLPADAEGDADADGDADGEGLDGPETLGALDADADVGAALTGPADFAGAASRTTNTTPTRSARVATNVTARRAP
jgi:hypothetical protein